MLMNKIIVWSGNGIMKVLIDNEEIKMMVSEKFLRPNNILGGKSLADFMLQNTDTLTFISLRELSRQTGVTEVTILNMCKTLGYNSFNEVKYEFRKLLGNGEKQQLYEGNEYYQIENRHKRL